MVKIDEKKSKNQYGFNCRVKEPMWASLLNPETKSIYKLIIVEWLFIMNNINSKSLIK